MPEQDKRLPGLNLGKKPSENSFEKVDNAPRTNREVEAERQSRTDDTLAANRAVSSGAASGGSEDGVTMYSSHPIRNYQIGPYHFEDGVLRVEDDKIGEFEKLLASLPESERVNIRKLDMSKVDRIVQRRQASKQFDSGLGRDALERLHGAHPTVGTQAIDERGNAAHEKIPQGDANQPVIPSPPIDDEGKSGLDQGAHTTDADPA